MAQTCGRCGETFEELVAGGCPGCGRKVVAGGRRDAPARISPPAEGARSLRLVALGILALLGVAGWFVYAKVTAAPPPPVVEAPKKKRTLKDWQAVVPPAKFIPGLDALRLQAAKADSAPLEAVIEDLRRVLTGAEQLHARVLLLSALEGTKGKQAVPLLSVLALRLPLPTGVEDVDDLRSLQRLTATAVLPFVDDRDADVRQGAAACAVFLAEGTSFRLLSPEMQAAVREGCHRLAKDERPATREAAAKALANLEK